MARKRNLNICKVHPDRFRDMTSDQLMNVWVRLGAGAPAQRKINQKVKALVVALAVAKQQEEHENRGTPAGNSSGASYRAQAERLTKEIYELQQKAGCVFSAGEIVARDAEHANRPDEARKLRRKAIIR